MFPTRQLVLTVLACVSFALAGYGSGTFLRQETAVAYVARSAIAAGAEAEKVGSDTLPPQPAVPMLSIHNPLVIPIGDTPAVSGGPFRDWPAVEDERRGLRVYHPQGWQFAVSKEELASLLSQMGDSATAQAVLARQAAHIEALTPAGQEEQFVGLGFQFAPDAPPSYVNRFDLRAIPAAGRTLEQYALQAAAQLEDSDVETLGSVKVGPGLRPWGEEVASLRYRNGGSVVEEGKTVTRPGKEVVGWQVVLLSPDGGTFLLITFDVWGDDFNGWLEPFLRDIVRRVQWLDYPAYDPPPGPTVTSTRTMYVREGPAIDRPIVGTVAAGDQYAVVSTNAAGDWWQIEYEGQLAWVFGGFVTPSAGAEDAPKADSTGWLTHDDIARGLSLSYPSGWHYFDPGRPSQVDLSLFSVAVKGRDGEKLDVTEMSAMVSAMSVRRDDAVIGLGLQSGPADSASSNFMLVFSVAAEGMTLERYAQVAAEHAYGIQPASVALVRGLRPLGEEIVSIRYRENATASDVWQVVLLSPDEKRLLVLGFSVHSKEFAALQPILREIVQSVRWAGVESLSSTRPAVPMLSIHNPLVIPVGDTPAASGGSFQDWPAVEDEKRGLTVYHPQGWLYAATKEELSSLQPQLGDSAAAKSVLARQVALFDSLTPADQEGQVVGYGFQYAPDTPSTYINRFTIRALPVAGQTLAQFALQLAARLEESEAEMLESVKVGPGLRPWGEEAVSIRYRSGDAAVEQGKVVKRPGTEVIGWQVVLLSAGRWVISIVHLCNMGRAVRQLAGAVDARHREAGSVAGPSCLRTTGQSYGNDHAHNVCTRGTGY